MAGDPKQNSPDNRQRLVTVIGGTGFLGRRMVRHLLDHGFTVRAAARHLERIQRLFAPGQAALQAVAA
ncbi:MAG TPA: NmrA family NAD(P)-binding protein, partial [Propylenella sp.]|nr:NmrA family NAD(P)-binding protein [Propylenella sp.]